MRGRGLKQQKNIKNNHYVLVAPHAGAWIETRSKLVRMIIDEVAPHAGAWIETC